MEVTLDENSIFQNDVQYSCIYSFSFSGTFPDSWKNVYVQTITAKQGYNCKKLQIQMCHKSLCWTEHQTRISKSFDLGGWFLNRKLAQRHYLSSTQ